jgi:hypothetical protein
MSTPELSLPFFVPLIPEEDVALRQSSFVNAMLGRFAFGVTPLINEQERIIRESVIAVDSRICDVSEDKWQVEFPPLAINNYGLDILTHELTEDALSDVIINLVRIGYELGSVEQIDVFNTSIVKWLESQGIYGFQLDALMQDAPLDKYMHKFNHHSVNERLMAVCKFGALLSKEDDREFYGKSKRIFQQLTLRSTALPDFVESLKF